MKKIVHIITGLNNGGAEAMLYKLLCETNQDKYNIEVISIMGFGVMGPLIEQLGIPIHCLNLNKRKNLWAAMMAARQTCNDADIIQCWMYHANIFGYMVNLFCRKKLIWGIRRGHLIKGKDKALTIMIAHICAKLSRKIDCIIYCAQKSRLFHEAMGYYSGNALVIPNGFDLDSFYKDEDARAKFREREEIPQSALVIAFVGRYSPVKGYENFIKAFSLMNGVLVDRQVIAVCAGTGVDESNGELVELVESFGLSDNIRLLGRRSDIPDLLSSADIFVSASFTEAFSNAIGEAMACELPCIVTDVGDSAYIVEKAGIVLEDNEPEQLADGMCKLLSLSDEQRRALGCKARQRVQELFDIKVVVRQYEKLYD